MSDFSGVLIFPEPVIESTSDTTPIRTGTVLKTVDDFDGVLQIADSERTCD